MKLLKLNLIVIISVFIFVNNSFSYERKVLVIGNGDYSFSPLRYSVSDAESMKKTLNDLNFKVTFLKNGKKADILKKLKAFTSKLTKDDIVLFYYSGHGIQMGNEIYIVPIIPVDRSLNNEIDAECESVKFTRILRNIVKADAKSNIFILDSCRENPFAGNFRNVTRGFSGVNSHGISNTIISYSTGKGNFAVDKNSYTKTLLKYIKIPGIKIEDVFKKSNCSHPTGKKR